MSDLICQKCGSKNPAWYADNNLFNQVNGSPDGILCPMCFQELADSKSINIIFKAEDMAKDDQSEIQRLTKELNDLGVKFDKELERWQERDAVELFRRKQLEYDVNFLTERGHVLEQEITRLRELLARCVPLLNDYFSETSVLTFQIDNELNPKP